MLRTSGTVLQLPGLPAMYDYELIPQPVRFSLIDAIKKKCITNARIDQPLFGGLGKVLASFSE